MDVPLQNSERTACHNELIRVLGAEFDRPFDMQARLVALVYTSAVVAP